MMEPQGNNRVAEKRRFERVDFNASVAVFHAGEFGLEKAVQISEGGMLLKVAVEYRVGEMFEASFFVSGAEYLSVVVEVRYAYRLMGATFVGVRFLGSGQNVAILKKEIREYVAEKTAFV